MNRLLALGLLFSGAAVAQIGFAPDVPLGEALIDPTPRQVWQDILPQDCPVFPSPALCISPDWQASACGAQDRDRASPLCPIVLQPLQVLATVNLPREPMLTVDHAD
jgi:hypothetical protein